MARASGCDGVDVVKTPQSRDMSTEAVLIDEPIQFSLFDNPQRQCAFGDSSNTPVSTQIQNTQLTSTPKTDNNHLVADIANNHDLNCLWSFWDYLDGWGKSAQEAIFTSGFSTVPKRKHMSAYGTCVSYINMFNALDSLLDQGISIERLIYLYTLWLSQPNKTESERPALTFLITWITAQQFNIQAKRLLLLTQPN
jgi:hypothetical protein